MAVRALRVVNEQAYVDGGDEWVSDAQPDSVDLLGRVLVAELVETYQRRKKEGSSHRADGGGRGNRAALLRHKGDEKKGEQRQ